MVQEKAMSQQLIFFADNVLDVFRRFQMMPGVKHSRKLPLSIILLNPEESIQLEDTIVNEGRISLKDAKSSWYYDSRFVENG